MKDTGCLEATGEHYVDDFYIEQMLQIHQKLPNCFQLYLARLLKCALLPFFTNVWPHDVLHDKFYTY